MDNEFMKDCLSRRISLWQVAEKYHMRLDEVYDEFMRVRARYTKDEIEAMMNEVYYKV